MAEVKKIEKKDELVEILLYFPDTSPYFKGHFPDLPVLPGFVQIDFAINLAKKHFGINQIVTNIKRMKFTKIISPNQDITLKLEYDSAGKTLDFQYHNNNSIYSSGKFYFK